MMNSRLDRINNWQELAAKAKYVAKGLAARCGVESRQLERYFRAKQRKPPSMWLRDERMRRAVGLLLESVTIKEVHDELGYRSAAHFSHDFRERFGISPSQFRSRSQAWRGRWKRGAWGVVRET
jgi:transcriptional regulator GlxA family with amidase domain